MTFSCCLLTDLFFDGFEQAGILFPDEFPIKMIKEKAHYLCKFAPVFDELF